MNTDDSPEAFRRESLADEIEQQAADWLALIEERELMPAEAAAFAAWRAADPKHEAAVEELQTAWHTFDRLRAYPCAERQSGDPDILVRARPVYYRPAVALTAAASLALASVLWWGSWRAADRSSAIVAATPAALATTLTLPDGSEVEFREGSEVVPIFTADERRVRLVRGEAHFSVAKNPNRPFIVEANGISVRAVGTAFNVRLATSGVEVLVTEGTVQVGPPSPGTSEAVPILVAGQRALVETAPMAAAAVVETLAPVEIDHALAWQTSRLVFEATPLADVLAQFNRHTPQRIVLRDPTLAALPVSGRFRAGNIESFLELLEKGLGVAVERRGGEISLRRAEGR